MSSTEAEDRLNAATQVIDKVMEEEKPIVSFLVTEPLKCVTCNHEFESKNQLHVHIKAAGHGRKVRFTTISSSGKKVLESVPDKDSMIVSPNTISNYHYMVAQSSFRSGSEVKNPTIIDTGCGDSVVEDSQLQFMEDVQLDTCDQRVKGMGGAVTLFGKKVTFPLYFDSEDGKTTVKVVGTYAVVPDGTMNGDAKILVANNIIIPNHMAVKGHEGQMTFEKLSVRIPVLAKKGPKLKTIYIRVLEDIVIPGYTSVLVPIRPLTDKLSSQAYEFVSEIEGLPVSIPPALITVNQKSILCNNFYDDDYILRKGKVLGYVKGLEKSVCVVWPEATGIMKSSFFVGEEADTPSNDVPLESDAPLKRDVSAKLKLPHDHLRTGDWLEREYVPDYKYPIPEGITVVTSRSIYELVDVNPELEESERIKLAKVIKRHKELFSDELGIVRELEEDWLRIPEPRDIDKMRNRNVYSVGRKNEEAIDATFDKLRAAGRLEDCHTSPIRLQVFVVNSANGKKKRLVVDMRPLNTAVPRDSYPLPR